MEFSQFQEQGHVERNANMESLWTSGCTGPSCPPGVSQGSSFPTHDTQLPGMEDNEEWDRTALVFRAHPPFQGITGGSSQLREGDTMGDYH